MLSAASGWGALVLCVWALAVGGWLAFPVALHAELLVWGVLGGAVLGFAGTAYPRQNDAAGPSPRVVLGVALLHTAWMTCLLGSAWLPVLAAPATALGALLWFAAFLWAAQIARRSLARAWDGTTLAVPVCLAVATASWLLARLGESPTGGVDLALHGWLIPLALGILDRVLPFFSRTIPGFVGVRRPWFAPALLAAGVARGLGWAVLDVAMLLVLGVGWWGWSPRSGMKVPMVAVLHVGITGLALGYVVDAARAFVPTIPRSVPVHLWVGAGLLVLLLGVATRVTLGHGRQPVVMGRALKGTLGLVGVGIAIRVGAPLLGGGSAAYVVAASLVAAAFVVWLGGYARFLVRA